MRQQVSRIVAGFHSHGFGVRLVEKGIHRYRCNASLFVAAEAQLHVVVPRAKVHSVAISHKAPP